MKELHTEGQRPTVIPSDALVALKGAAKGLQGHVQARLLSREIRCTVVPTLWERRRATSLMAFSRASSGFARSKNPCMYAISFREKREITCPPVWPFTRRAARGRLRPQSRGERTWEFRWFRNV